MEGTSPENALPESPGILHIFDDSSLAPAITGGPTRTSHGCRCADSAAVGLLPRQSGTTTYALPGCSRATQSAKPARPSPPVTPDPAAHAEHVMTTGGPSAPVLSPAALGWMDGWIDC